MYITVIGDGVPFFLFLATNTILGGSITYINGMISSQIYVYNKPNADSRNIIDKLSSILSGLEINRFFSRCT